MSRWKALPAELDPRVRQLLVRLRRLKDHNGLTMRQLAARTGYSAKSWERYLSGRSVPPRDAVEAMARIGGEDPTRLLALHEVAVAAWRDRPPGAPEQDAPEEGTAEHAVTEPALTETVLTDAGPSAVAAVAPVPAGAEAAAPEPEQVTTSATRAAGGPRISRRALSIALVSGSVALVLAASAAVFVAVRIMDDDKGGAPAPAGHAASAAAAPPAATKAAYSCHLERADGHWYAGNSRATDSTVAYGDSGPQVAEVQCLLRRAGISPGGIDGMFGPLTMGAVERFQRQAHLDVDGIAGPHTWKALRG